MKADVQEMLVWQQRATSLEKEVNQLRQWKRQYQETHATNTQPAKNSSSVVNAALSSQPHTQILQTSYNTSQNPPSHSSLSPNSFHNSLNRDLRNITSFEPQNAPETNNLPSANSLYPRISSLQNLPSSYNSHLASHHSLNSHNLNNLPRSHSDSGLAPSSSYTHLSNAHSSHATSLSSLSPSLLGSGSTGSERERLNIPGNSLQLPAAAGGYGLGLGGLSNPSWQPQTYDHSSTFHAGNTASPPNTTSALHSHVSRVRSLPNPPSHQRLNHGAPIPGSGFRLTLIDDTPSSSPKITPPGGDANAIWSSSQALSLNQVQSSVKGETPSEYQVQLISDDSSDHTYGPASRSSSSGSF